MDQDQDEYVKKILERRKKLSQMRVCSSCKFTTMEEPCHVCGTPGGE